MKKEINMVEQETLMQLAQFEEEMKELEQRTAMVDQQIIELQGLENNLGEIEKSKENKILAGLGKGIFIPAELKSRELLVDVGSNVIVKKSFADTKEIVNEQVKKMFDFKKRIIARMEDIREEIEKLIRQPEQTR